jgi:hypothetical protein
MSASPLTPAQQRTAYQLAAKIASGYRANLLRDHLSFVEAVAEELARLTGTDVADAIVTLIERHRALADWPASVPPRPSRRDEHRWMPARMITHRPRKDTPHV